MAALVATRRMTGPSLREGDLVELLPGAPVSQRYHLSPGSTGRIIDVEAPDDRDATGFVGMPLRVHRLSLRRVGS
jgi:hypothetical protein